MTPKEEAVKLVSKFSKFDYQVNGFKYITEMEHEAAKRCAEICINDKLISFYEVEFYKKEDALKIFKHHIAIKAEITKL
jgi:hypothetical protein